MQIIPQSLAATSVLLTTIAFNLAPVEAYEIKSIDTDTTGTREIIKEFQQFVQEERDEIDNPDAFRLNPNKLILAEDFDVSVFFVDEGAGFKNQLEFTVTDGSRNTIFNDVSCHTRNTDCQVPSDDGVLNIGDYVELGNFQAGTKFDFTILADGFRDGDTRDNRYGGNPQDNPDGLQHMVAWEYKDYVLIGFEDLYGPLDATEPPNQNSDRDFNDVFFAVRMPVLEEARDIPEPSTALSLLGIGLASIFHLRSCHKSLKNLNQGQ